MKKYILKFLLVLISISLLTSYSTSTNKYSEIEINEIISESNNIIYNILSLSII